MSIKKLFADSIKSSDTEENIDIYFTRPIGLVLTLFYKAINFHPNVVTIIGIVIGVIGASQFFYTDLRHNLMGVLLMTIANFHDSADGQLARLTGKKTLTGRMLDGFSADAVFFCVYLAIFLRSFVYAEEDVVLRNAVVAFAVCFCAGIFAHSRQCALSDYYRQIHLFFLKGKDEADFDNSKVQERKRKDAVENKKFWDWAFYINYRNYCRRQEKMTPQFQNFFAEYSAMQSAEKKEEVKEQLLDGSRPLMKYTNFLTYNWRAITLFTACCLNMPLLYPCIELTIFAFVCYYMQTKHETLCSRLSSLITEQQ